MRLTVESIPLLPEKRRTSWILALCEHRCLKRTHVCADIPGLCHSKLHFEAMVWLNPGMLQGVLMNKLPFSSQLSV
jgi:hypothetical protein